MRLVLTQTDSNRILPTGLPMAAGDPLLAIPWACADISPDIASMDKRYIASTVKGAN